jgi:hypothetical protein
MIPTSETIKFMMLAAITRPQTARLDTETSGDGCLLCKFGSRRHFLSIPSSFTPSFGIDPYARAPTNALDRMHETLWPEDHLLRIPTDGKKLRLPALDSKKLIIIDGAIP